MNDDRSVLPGFWDGAIGGFCVGVSVFTIFFVVWQVVAAIAAGRL